MKKIREKEEEIVYFVALFKQIWICATKPANNLFIYSPQFFIEILHQIIYKIANSFSKNHQKTLFVIFKNILYKEI